MKEEIRVCVMHECKGAHIHTYPQILVPIRNRMTIRVEDEEFQLSPKELCFIPQGMEHVCDFSGELLVMTLTEPGGAVPVPLPLQQADRTMHITVAPLHPGSFRPPGDRGVSRKTGKVQCELLHGLV